MLKAIIVDDEKRSIDNLAQLIQQYCSDIEVIDKLRDIDTAYDAIEKYHPDIVFLDIDMPPASGFDLLRKYEDIPFEVIFVTAYDFYAIDAIKFSAAYYIMKPVKIDELRAAIEKVKKTMHKKNKLYAQYFRELNLAENTHSKLMIHSLKKSEMISLESISYLKADGDYTIFYLKSGKNIICSQKSIKEYEEMLADKGFFRSHKSYMVNIQEIDSLDKTNGLELLLKDKSIIPLAYRRKNIFYKLFGT